MKIIPIITIVITMLLATNIYAKQNMGNSGNRGSVVNTVTGNVPPGLQNKSTPPGLQMQNKTPPGWYKGEKKGWKIKHNQFKNKGVKPIKTNINPIYKDSKVINHDILN